VTNITGITYESRIEKKLVISFAPYGNWRDINHVIIIIIIIIWYSVVTV